MKIKIYIAFAALLLCLSAAKAQVGPHVGLHYTYGISSIIDRERWGDAPYDYRYTSVNLGGLALGYNFSSLIGVEGELNYAWHGVKTTQNPSGSQFDRDLHLQYIQIPVMMKVSSGHGTVRFMASLGPQVGFTMASKRYTSAHQGFTILPTGTPQPAEPAIPPSFFIQQENVATFSIPAVTENVRNETHNVDLGAVAQVGTEIFVAPMVYLTVAARGYYGFTNINRVDFLLTDPQPGGKERLGNVYGGLNFGVHYMLGQ